ncbi:unnamed protein product [Echinostoma caproni]|uniref:Uncharacterized protein n=1 Tax=Echinostoma caproni TaxID=27848 RepID=A0A183BAF0_9TREM|nr:unnamed protein product [Echinostoma caproni]
MHLDGLNFHGHKLIVRRAHLTRDELTSVQQSEIEAARLRIAEQAKLCEEKLAARLAADTTTDDSQSIQPTAVVSKTDLIDSSQPDSHSASATMDYGLLAPRPTIPDLYGRLGRVDPIRKQSSSSLSIKNGGEYSFFIYTQSCLLACVYTCTCDLFEPRITWRQHIA